MTFITRRAHKGFAFVLLAVLAGAASARGAAYTVLDLGTLGGTQSGTDGFHVLNASGQVVGESFTNSDAADHAFRTAANGPIVRGAGGSDLGTLGGTNSVASGINASGQAVGYANGSSGPHAFRTAANGAIVAGPGGSDLGTLGGSSFANGINASGQVAGSSDIPGNFAQHAFRTAANGPIVPGAGGSDLGTLGGTNSFAYGINASGQTVGYSDTTGNAAQHAFRTLANGAIVQGAGGSDLGTLGGTISYAYGINDSGQVVGQASLTGNTASHAFRTAANGAIIPGPGGSDLGTLGGTSSGAYDINALGQVVGYSQTTGNAAQHAFFADVTGPMLDLNTLIDPGSGWVLTEARGINDSGQIAGTGRIGGQSHAFLLTLTPEPASLSLLALAAMGLLSRARRRTA